MKTPDQLLMEMAETFREKGKVYGHTYHETGQALAAIFPNGIKLKSADDFNRFLTLGLMMLKMNRYAVNFEKGGHQDSVHDLAVYAAILEFIDGPEQ